jgi:putative inorganic carbon (HCO3(-)) transporter
MGSLELLRKDVAGKPLLWLFAGVLMAGVAFLLTTPYPVLAVLPGLSLIALMLFGRYPQVGFFMLVSMIPLDAFTGLSSVYPTLTLSKFLGFWIVIVALCAILTRKQWPGTLRSTLWPALFALQVVCFLSLLFSANPLIALDNMRKLFVVMLFFGLTLLYVDSEKVFNTVLPKVVVFSSGFGSVLSLLGSLFGISWFMVSMAPEATAIKRATGAATDPNMFSLMILFSIPLVVNLLFAATTAKKRLFWGMLFLLEIATIVLTYSRSAALVLCLLLLSLGIRYRRHLKPRYIGLATTGLLVGMIAVAVMVPASYWNRHKQVLSSGDTSVQARLSYLAVGRDEFLRNPLLGSGLGTFEIAYAGSKYAFANPYDLSGELARRSAHNAYVEILVGTGLLGLGVFLLIIGLAWRNFGKAAALSRAGGNMTLKDMIISYQFSFAAVLLHLLTLSRFNHKYLWMALALSQVALTLAQRKSRTVPHECIHPAQ